MGCAGRARNPRGKSTLPLTRCRSTLREQRRSCRAARSRAWPAIRGTTPYTSTLCPSMPSRPPRLAVMTLLLHIFYPPWAPCASPPTFLPLTTSTTPVPTTSPVRAWRFGETADGVIWPCAPAAVPTYRHLSAPVRTCRHPLPVASLWDPLSQHATSCAGRDTTHRGGRAPARVERWHRTCTLSDSIRALQQVAWSVMPFALGERQAQRERLPCLNASTREGRP